MGIVIFRVRLKVENARALLGLRVLCLLPFDAAGR